MTASEVKERLSEIEKSLAQESQLKDMISEAVKQKEALEVERKACVASTMLLRMALKEKINVKEHIEGINTGILRAVFGRNYDYKFEVRTDPEGMVNGLIPQIRYLGMPFKAGGGASNTAGLGNRLGVVFADPTSPPVMLLDEPSTNLDQGKWEKFIEVLTEVARETDTQVFFISHSGFKLDQTFHVAKVGTSSKITEKSRS